MSELKEIFEGWAKDKYQFKVDPNNTHDANELIKARINTNRVYYTEALIDRLENVSVKFAEWLNLNHVAWKGQNWTLKELFAYFLTNVYQSPIK